MEFSPAHPIVQLCLQGMALEEQGNSIEAGTRFLDAWNEATHDLEKFLAAYYVARNHNAARDKIQWYETSLQFALEVYDPATKSALPALHAALALCYAEIGDDENARKHHILAQAHTGAPDDAGPFFHGTKADLQVGDLLTPGRKSNYDADLVMNHIYFTALPNGAGLAASLAQGDGRERVYVVQPLGEFEHDPNLTDKKFPGNMTRSYRTTLPLRIIGEVDDWSKQTEEDIQKWREKLANSNGEIIN